MQSSQLWIKHQQVFIFPVRWGLRSNGGTGGLSVLVLSSCSYHYYHSRVNNQLSGQEGKTCFSYKLVSILQTLSHRSLDWLHSTLILRNTDTASSFQNFSVVPASPQQNIGCHSPAMACWEHSPTVWVSISGWCWQGQDWARILRQPKEFLFLTIFCCPTHLMIGIITITVGTTLCPKSYKFGI